MRLRKVCPQCNTVVHVKGSVCDCGHAFASKKMKARCTAVGESENAMKRRKALLSEEELLVTKQRDKVRSQVHMPLIQVREVLQPLILRRNLSTPSITCTFFT